MKSQKAHKGVPNSGAGGRTAPAGSSHRSGLVPGSCLLVVLTLVVYIPAMKAGVVWDDNWLVLENEFIQSADGLYHFWFTTDPPDYFPLTSTTWWIEWRLWGDDPTGYHVVNVLLHAMSAVVLWRVLRRLKVPGAFVAAAVFAVHPVAVESVAWIAERKNTLSMLLFALSILGYLRFEDSPPKAGRGWYGAALLSFLLALLAKTSVAVMPLVLVGLAWWRRGRITRTDMVRAAPFFLFSMVLGMVTVFYQHGQMAETVAVRPEGLFSRAAASGWCVWFYLYKAVLPTGLAMVYPRWEVDPSGLAAWGPLLGLLAVAGVAWRFRQVWGRAVLAMLAYFVGMLLPVLGFVEMTYHRYSLVADHLQHLALIGPIALIVAAVATLAARWRAGRAAATTLAVGVVAVLGGLTWGQARVYESEQTLWRDTLLKNPNAWIAHNNLANELRAEGKLGEAIQHYREALRTLPDYAEAHANLGIALRLEGRLVEAIHHYGEAVRIDPRHAKAQFNLGSALLAQGEVDDAIRHLQQVLQVQPEYAKAHNNLGKALETRGDLDEAIRHYRQALRIDSGYATAHHNLGSAFRAQGKLEEALTHFRSAVRLRPDDPAALIGAAWILATHPERQVRDATRAIELAERASKLTDGRDAGVLDTLAAAYAAAGEFERAMATAQKALSLTLKSQSERRAEQIRGRLELYRQRKPYRLSVSSRLTETERPLPGGRGSDRGSEE